MTDIDAILEAVAIMQLDHSPTGYPAITMGEVSALAAEVERLRVELASARNILDRVADSPLRLAVCQQSNAALRKQLAEAERGRTTRRADRPA